MRDKDFDNWFKKEYGEDAPNWDYTYHDLKRAFEAGVLSNNASPWPLRDILKMLVRSSEILLQEKSYDGHGYEEIVTAKQQAKKYIDGSE